MKKLVPMLFASLFASLAAHADTTIELSHINTSDCGRAQTEVMLLNSQTVKVDAECAGPGSYGPNARPYQLTTMVTIAGDTTPGENVQLGNIDTNDCTWAQNEIMLLNSTKAPITADCSVYSAGGYSDNGNVYDYRLTTSLIVQ